MGLSAGEIKAVQSVWGQVEPKVTDHGEEIFLQFFNVHPESQNYFKHFKGKSTSEIKGTRQLRSQGQVVLEKIGSYIKMLDDQEALDGLFEKSAETHIRLQVPTSEFTKLNAVVIDYLATKLGGGIMTPEATAAMSSFLNMMVTEVEKFTANAK